MVALTVLTHLVSSFFARKVNVQKRDIVAYPKVE